MGFLSGGGEALELSGHQIHHVVGVALGADAVYVPSPSWYGWVEREQLFFGQRGKELDRKERIAAGLLLHHLCQGPRVLRLAVQSIGDKPADIVDPERRQHDLVHLCSSFADRLERPQKRVRGADLVVPVGAD
jgi:hypothetical protein